MDSLDEGISPYEKANKIRDTFRGLLDITSDQIKFETKIINQFIDWKIKNITVSFNDNDWILKINNQDNTYEIIRGEHFFFALISNITKGINTISKTDLEKFYLKS